MKKNIMISLSVILLIAILFVPFNKINANELENKIYNYDNSTGVVANYDKFSTALEEARIYLEQYKEDYYYFIRFDSMKIYVDIVEKKSSINAYINLHSSSISYVHGSASTKLNYLKFEATDLNDFQTKFSTFKTNLENNSFTYNVWSSSSNSTYTSTGGLSSAFIRVYYTNFDNFILSDDSIYNLNLNSEMIIKPGEKIPTYYDYYNSKGIDISSNFMCDLNGKDMEFVTIDFSDYQDINYTYQYGIKRHVNSDIVWYDISELTNWTYSFNEYYNGTYIYARVLDNNNNIVSENQYQIVNENIPKFEMVVTSSLMCPIPNYDGDPVAEVIRIDLTNCYSDKYTYEYSYNASVFHEIDVEDGKFIYELREYFRFHYHFRIKDENGNVIYQTFGKRTTDDLYELDRNRGKIFISEGTACDLQNNKIINITMDFSNITKFINEYDFDVVINGVHYGAIQYHQITLNRENYTQFYEIQIYIDGLVEFSTKYTVGYLVENKPIQGTFDEMTFEEMYDKLIDNNIADLEMNVKDLTGMKNLVLGFFRMIYSFIATFFDLAIYFFNCLNVWLRACIISLLIIFLITKIIKAARK